MERRERDKVIDLARAFAIICVILTHTTETTYQLQAEAVWGGKHIKLLALSLFAIGRLGVPIFLFLTGYLLLDREYSMEKMKHFWNNNLKSLFMITEIWIIIYFVFLCLFYNVSPDWMKLIKQITFLKNPDINHLWYMGQILRLYLALPIVANVLLHMEKKMIVILTVIAFIYTFLPSTLNPILSLINEEYIYPQINTNFFGGHYGLMILMGWMLKKGYFDKIKNWIIALAGLLSYGGVVWMEFYSYEQGITYNVWYDFAPLVLTSFCILALVLRMKIIPFKEAFSWIGYSSFAVYLIHNVFCKLSFKWISQYLVSHIQTEIILFLMVFLLSEGSVYLISRNKKVARYLFYMR